MAKRKKDKELEVISVAKRMMRARAERLAEVMEGDLRVSELQRQLYLAWLEGLAEGLRVAESYRVPSLLFLNHPRRA